jgi:hypothetical protein
MDPLGLGPEEHADLYAAARRRAHELREQAISDAIVAAVGWLRGCFAARRATVEGEPCHS